MVGRVLWPELEPQVAAAGAQHDLVVAELLLWLRQQLHRPLDRAALAQRCGLSPTRFSDVFTATGLPVGRFVVNSVIIATGARANWLGLPNEQRLAHSGGGVSACAVCDGALPAFRDRVVAVVGGGDSAMEEAVYLTKFAHEVVIIHRRDEFRASKIMQDRAMKNERISFLWNTAVEDVLG